jgi:hypothetical protein
VITLIHTCILFSCMLAEPAPAFAIYAVVPELTCVFGGEPRSTIDLNSVTLSDTPWLTDSDVKEYDPATTTFSLSRAREVSLPRTSVFGTAWVIVVEGKRHSAGMFWTSWSSWCCCPLPSIDVTPKAVTVPKEECGEWPVVYGVSPEVLVCATFPDASLAQFSINGLSDGDTLREVFKRLGKAKQ